MHCSEVLDQGTRLYVVVHCLDLSIQDWLRLDNKPYEIVEKDQEEAKPKHNKYDCPICVEVNTYYQAVTIAETYGPEVTPFWAQAIIHKYDKDKVPFPKCPYA
jgi:hypothetical protein